jgi:hypothetical protein
VAAAVDEGVIRQMQKFRKKLKHYEIGYGLLYIPKKLRPLFPACGEPVKIIDAYGEEFIKKIHKTQQRIDGLTQLYKKHGSFDLIVTIEVNPQSIGTVRVYFQSIPARPPQTPAKLGNQLIDEDEESTFPEGKRLYKLHRRLERDRKITRKAKEKRLRETRDLCCDACSFSFEKTYGPRGARYIEAHHIIPVSELEEKRKTKLAEIALNRTTQHSYTQAACGKVSSCEISAARSASTAAVTSGV